MEGEATSTTASGAGGSVSNLSSSDHLYQVFQNSYNKVAQNGLEDYCDPGWGYGHPQGAGGEFNGGGDYRYTYESGVGNIVTNGGNAVNAVNSVNNANNGNYYNPYDAYSGSHYVEGLEGGPASSVWPQSTYVPSTTTPAPAPVPVSVSVPQQAQQAQQAQAHQQSSSQVKSEYDELLLSGPSPSSASSATSSSYLPPHQQPSTSAAHDADFSSMLGTNDFMPVEDGRRSRGSTTSSTKSNSKGGRGGGSGSGGGKRKKVEELMDPVTKAARDKERRFSNNTRERMRIRDINDALTELGRICMSLDGKERTEKPQTKLGVLNMAVEVITKLEQRVRDKNLNPTVLCLNRNEPRGAAGAPPPPPHAVLQQQHQHYESPSLDMNQRR